MGLLTFKGGVHPNDGKSLAKDKAIVELLPQGDLVYPLSQHIGAPAKPVVAKNCRSGGLRVCTDLCIRIRYCKSD